MKKLYFCFMLLSCMVTIAHAQTYAYRHLYTVDENGVKRAGSNGIVYITFVNEKSKFYPSDENGISKSYGDRVMGFGTVGVCLYVGKVDGKYKYVVDTSVKTVPYSGGYDPYGAKRTANKIANNTATAVAEVAKQVGGIYRFSSDFKKLNVTPYLLRRDGGIYDDVIDVYEKYIPGNTKSEFYE